MKPINLIVPEHNMRRWHQIVAERLTASGFDVSIATRNADPRAVLADWILGFETKLFLRNRTRLSASVASSRKQEPHPDALILDLTGAAPAGPNTLNLNLTSGNRLCELAAAVASGALPDIAISRNGEIIATARPMIDDRTITIRGVEDVLARAITLAVTTVEKLSQNQPLLPIADLPALPKARRFSLAYATSAAPRLLGEIIRRQRYHYAHWRVGYRVNNNAKIAETADLSGPDWRILPDDGTRFYADPFAFSHEGTNCIFVEDYPHATGKAIISVAEINADGTATTPRPIIEEDWHLSYPQVFERNGDIWMLPEASGSNKLTLYRATDFPYQWEPHAILLEDCQLSDATLLEHNNKLYLFATDRGGHGSTSDTMVIYCADKLEGPWAPHPANPVCIDRTCARPGGAVIASGKNLFLPVQDGTLGYGGRLNLIEIKKLTPTQITLGAPEPIIAEGHWPHPKIHTYNRHDNLEVIDGIAAVRKP